MLCESSSLFWTASETLFDSMVSRIKSHFPVLNHPVNALIIERKKKMNIIIKNTCCIEIVKHNMLSDLAGQVVRESRQQ